MIWQQKEGQNEIRHLKFGKMIIDAEVTAVRKMQKAVGTPDLYNEEE